MTRGVGQGNGVIAAALECRAKCFGILAVILAEAEQRLPNAGEHAGERALRCDPVVAAVGVVVTQGRQDRGSGKAFAELGGEEANDLGGEIAIGLRVLEVRLGGDGVEPGLPLMSQKVTRVEDEIGIRAALAGIVEAALQQGVIAVLPPRAEPGRL